MNNVNVATGTLIILGAVMASLGLFGGPLYPVILMGLGSIVAAGVLGIAAGRR